MNRSNTESPDAFFCHDSRDKDMAREIVRELSAARFNVWFDEYSLRPGDRLRESIERGLKESKSCMLLISKNFLENPGWTKVEFNSIFTREILERGDFIVPIWYGVSAKEVYEYSPSLANRVAVVWGEGKSPDVPDPLGKLISTLADRR